MDKTIKAMIQAIGADKRNENSVLSCVRVRDGGATVSNLREFFYWTDDETRAQENGLYSARVLLAAGIWEENPIGNEKFPDMPTSTDYKTTSIDRDAFIEAAPFVSDDETRYFMTGVYCAIAGGEPITVATDGRRLYANGDFSGEDHDSLTIRPTKAMLAMLKSRPPRSNASITVGTIDGKRWIYAGVGFSGIYGAVAVEGQFPNFRRVIPSYKGPLKMALPSKDTIKKWKAIESFKGADNAPAIYEKGKWSRGPVVEEVPGDPSIKIAFNPRYLLEAVDAGVKEVYVENGEKGAQRAVYGHTTHETIMVIMPMAIADATDEWKEGK